MTNHIANLWRTFHRTVLNRESDRGLDCEHAIFMAGAIGVFYLILCSEADEEDQTRERIEAIDKEIDEYNATIIRTVLAQESVH